MLKIQIILGTTRSNRQGKKIAEWIYKLASTDKRMEVELLDLRDWPMPFYDEPTPPEAQKWIDKVNESDGYIIVTPEYNHGYPAVLKNALDYPYEEWNNKPITFVGYSNGLGGGVRAIEQLRQVAIELQMAPIREAVHIPKVKEAFDENDNIKDEFFVKKVGKLLDQLVFWAEALKKAR